jgi:glyoxylate/hydroxypyruvate reductase A
VRILLQMPGRAVEAWRDALATAIPEAAVTVWPDLPARCDYAIVWRPPVELFARSRPAKAIFNCGAGVDALLAVPTLPSDVPVIRLEDAGMAEQMAEYATLAVLAAYREAQVYAEEQREAHWRPRPRIPKTSFGVGLLGYGVLGRAIAASVGAFGFPVAAWSRTRKPDEFVASFAGRGELPAFLARTRILVCTLPSTPETAGLLDRTTLAMLPAGAHVVNVARGEVLVDADLISLLDKGRLAGATLDVFRVEPLPPDHPFWHHPRVIVTPHVSAVTLVDVSVAQIADKIRRLELGEAVTGVVDRGRGY